MFSESNNKNRCCWSVFSTSFSFLNFFYKMIKTFFLRFFCGGYTQNTCGPMLSANQKLWTGSVSTTLTCVERYLAVTKPITYNRLRQANGIRIRNISIGKVCILYLLNFIVYHLVSSDGSDLIMFFCITGFILTVICSISVLCALPGPEELSRNRERVDQSKQRAFYTICAFDKDWALYDWHFYI